MINKYRSNCTGRQTDTCLKSNKLDFQKGHKANNRGLIQAIILIMMVLVLFTGFYLKPKEKEWIVEAHYSGESEMTSPTIQQDNNKKNSYPEDVNEREKYIREYLATKYTVKELQNEEIENLIRIAKVESSRHDPEVQPKTTVFHCKRNGKWFVVENFIGCPSDSTPGRKEKSIGIFQILPSTFQGYKCEGNIKEVDRQLDCVVKIYKRSGYKAWYLSSKKLGII